MIGQRSQFDFIFGVFGITPSGIDRGIRFQSGTEVEFLLEVGVSVPTGKVLTVVVVAILQLCVPGSGDRIFTVHVGSIVIDAVRTEGLGVLSGPIEIDVARLSRGLGLLVGIINPAGIECDLIIREFQCETRRGYSG